MHLEHLRELEREGKIKFAGPIFADDGTTPVGSVIIFESEDLALARAFVYREHAGNAPEPVVDDSITLSMSSGPAFSVHGVRFEVIDATPDNLTYKVLQNFQ